ncbi:MULTISPECIES: membrane metalloprotease [Galbibacter]|uniref:Membrane metalloprotease n=1 Tax=Galbibacter pacificus TaxID=2996052 RepID=A0ABT6FMC3_9FLAO|nr:membrane metalloprotease [Galbibacter pacificus]MDG3580939.1 membrane metalloprotease [Galbibacter pacificus]MDG3584417.1 membrane metalloprotease [Galbibacter pacificus]
MSKQLIKAALLSTILFLSACSKDDDIQDNGNSTIGNRLSTGDSAHEILSDEEFTDMVIEVVYVEGYQPSQISLNNLTSFIKQRCYKPGGIELNLRAIQAPGKETYTIQEIDSIEREIRSQYNNGKRLALFISFMDGSFNEDTDSSVVLGVAYRNTSFVVFEETIQTLSDQITEPDRDLLESTVLRHEFSHLLGLVDLGTDMLTDHLDTENGHHCNVESCLMNFKVESGVNLIGMSSEENIPKLDQQCLADLKANGGK